jgi:molecular chaperone DnaJ
VAEKRDYYEVLGVDRSAGPDELKRSYRKLALKYHPDRNQEADAESRFKEVSEAYQVLSDPQKREAYDRFGHQGLGGAGYQAGFQNVDDIFSHFSDIFGDLFGFGGVGGGGRRRARRGADIEYPLEVDFLEAVHGCKHVVAVPKHKLCDTCGGSGAAPGSQPTTCGTCGGQGEVIQAQGFFRIRTTCPTCRGEGRVIQEPCPECRGRRAIPATEKLEITLPAGVDDDMQLRLAGKGEPSLAGGPPGDLYVTVRVKKHPDFERRGLDIYSQVPMSFPQACLGTTLNVETVDGLQELEIPPGTPSGKVFRLYSKGVSAVRRRQRGDHYVQAVVAVPKTLSSEEEVLIRKLAELQDERVQEKGFFRDLMDRLKQ